MFIFNVFPIWGALLIIVVGVITYLIAIRTGDGFNEPITPTIVAVLTSFLGILLFTLSPLSEVTVSNPQEKPWNTIQSGVNKEELNKIIAKTIDADKAAISVDESKDVIGDMADGGIFEFTAIDEGSTQHGSFYFTDDSLEIVLQGEKTDVQEFSIRTK